MAESIERGKQQILFNYLPGKVFDFGRKSIIAKIEKIRGNTFHRLNHSLIIRKIAEHAMAWNEPYRPALSNSVLQDESRFVTIDPTHATSEMYPLVFWCSNNSCKKVYNYTIINQLPRNRSCARCHTGKLTQIRFVKIHRCGHIEPLTPWSCPACHSNEVALDDRGSERFANFRWRCLNCAHLWAVWPGNCNRCSWPSGDAMDQQMSVEVFRSNRTFYIHSVTMLNIPEGTYNSFFNATDWHVVSAAKYLHIEALQNTKLHEYITQLNREHIGGNISEAALGPLLDQLNRGEISVSEYTSKIQEARNRSNPSIDELKETIRLQSGVNSEIWDEAKFDIVDSLIPFEIGTTKDLLAQPILTKANNLGLARITLIDDFPIIISSYGFSRVESKPQGNDHEPLCYLNPFPADRDHGGRFPIFVDKVQADAILFQLDPFKIIAWLRLNDFQVNIQPGQHQLQAALGYFVNLFHEINIHEKIFRDRAIERLVLGLVHTFSHLAIRHAALLCGLDKTSIAEYIVPKTLSIAFYCNHRFGATIGALTALFEQSLNEWLDQIELERRCVYDPVCFEKGANCHSCTHLAETSCKLFNQNLGRIYLFGGFDTELEREVIGFFDPRVQGQI